MTSLALLFALPFLLVPARIPIIRSAGINLRSEPAFRAITDTADWKKWWPSGLRGENGSYGFSGLNFGPPKFYYHAVGLDISNGHTSHQTRIVIIPAGQDSVIISWTDSLTSPSSPMARWQMQQKAENQAAVMEKILKSLQQYLTNPVNVYGFRLVHETSRDSTLISVLFQTPDSPGTALIYQKLDGLKAYVVAQHAAIVNFPMMHIEGKNGSYLTMLAYPVNKVLPDSGPYKFKRFLPWKMISAEVRGGEPVIRAGYRQFYQYISDYGIPVMANSFAFLVTDRSREPDSSKWVTRFSAPIP